MSFCSHFVRGACRSCALIETPYQLQLREKESRLQAMVKIALDPSTESMPQGFRQKIKMAVAGDLTHPIIGLAQLEQSHELYDCPIQSPTLNQSLPLLFEFIKKWKLTPYSIQERRGELKALILSHSPASAELMLRFVLRSKEALDRIRQGAASLAQFKVLSVNIQPIPQAILEGEEEIILSSDHFITHTYGGINVHYGPQSFMQTNLAVAESLYRRAREWAQELAVSRVADLFCGSGAFALHLATPERSVLGFEVSAEAVSLATLAAQTQKLQASFQAHRSEEIFDQLTTFRPELVVVNPPRRGLGLSLGPLMALAPEYVLYSSCSPESFESDLQVLLKSYRPVRSQLFDMFPHTHHFESLTLLQRK